MVLHFRVGIFIFQLRSPLRHLRTSTSGGRNLHQISRRSRGCGGEDRSLRTLLPWNLGRVRKGTEVEGPGLAGGWWGGGRHSQQLELDYAGGGVASLRVREESGGDRACTGACAYGCVEARVSASEDICVRVSNVSLHIAHE